MSSAAKILPYYTYDDWKHWQDRWELIHGVPYAMSPAPVPKHQRVSANIKFEFISELRKNACNKCHVYDFIDYKVADDTIIQPDALIVCGEIEKPFLDFAPALVVEILSPSTALKDRNNKFEIYEQQKVKYYLIVDADKELVEIYTLDNNKKYAAQPFNAAQSFTFTFDDCSIDVVLHNIWQ